MYANFTEETCTGTGATLALAGATTSNIPFSESFADGDLVAYVLEDSGGTIKIAGIGTYVSATDDITRNDTWNWNGTVVDKEPSTNITLSGGTHTVRCSAHNQDLISVHNLYGYEMAGSGNYLNTAAAGTNLALVADRIYLTKLTISKNINITALGNFNINVAGVASSFFRVGIYSVQYDSTGYMIPDQLLVQSADILCDTTGFNRLDGTVNFDLQKGVYIIGIISDDTPTVQGFNNNKFDYSRHALSSTAITPIVGYFYDVTTGWSVMPDLSAVTYASYSTNGFSTPFGVARGTYL